VEESVDLLVEIVAVSEAVVVVAVGINIVAAVGKVVVFVGTGKGLCRSKNPLAC
jgi:hypothetical protein